jgi:hypothetical protein
MTFEQRFTLIEAIDATIDAMPGASVRDLVVWFRLHRRGVCDDNSETIGTLGLSQLFRERKKKRTPREEAATDNLCFDFGLPAMELDVEISIPLEKDNLLYGKCEWREIDDASIPNVEQHALYLDAQEQSIHAKAANYRLIIRAAKRFLKPGDPPDITLGILRERARQANNQKAS